MPTTTIFRDILIWSKHFVDNKHYKVILAHVVAHNNDGTVYLRLAVGMIVILIPPWADIHVNDSHGWQRSDRV